ncbi:MAG: hypothetical protein GY954_06260, partial [Alteromonas sp.]|nr:hypothetical protein [Alteromonas sp.]
VGEVQADGDLRGNEHYAKKHYLILDETSLFAKLVELKELRKIARLDSIRPGEVTSSDLATEISAIKKEFHRRWQKAGKQPYAEKERLAEAYKKASFGKNKTTKYLLTQSNKGLY